MGRVRKLGRVGRDGLVGRDDREKGGMGQKKVLHVGRRLNGSGVLKVCREMVK